MLKWNTCQEIFLNIRWFLCLQQLQCVSKLNSSDQHSSPTRAGVAKLKKTKNHCRSQRKLPLSFVTGGDNVEFIYILKIITVFFLSKKYCRCFRKQAINLGLGVRQICSFA